MLGRLFDILVLHGIIFPPRRDTGCAFPRGKSGLVPEIVPPIGEHGVGTLVLFGHTLGNGGNTQRCAIGETRGVFDQPNGMAGGRVRVPVPLNEFNRETQRQFTCEIVVGSTLTNPNRHGVVVVRELFVPRVTFQSLWCVPGLTRLGVVYPVGGVQHLTRLENHFTDMLVAVPLGALVGVNGQQKQVHVSS